MRKMIQDPVQGTIEIDGVFLKILDRPEMQRLRLVRQLGLGNLVFPGANHTRFEHCLGTYHLAGRMAAAIGLNGEDSTAVRMAGLLHDVCHPPFSHAMETIMEKQYGANHMDMAGLLISGKIPFLRREDEELFGNLPPISEVLTSEGIDADAVCGLISSPETTGTEVLDIFWDKHGYFPSKDYAHQIIHGPVDADQMDYLMRDSHYTGVCHGRIDCDRLIKTMSVVNDRIVLNRGGVVAAEGLMASRSLMYTSVYFHETTRIAQRMMAKAAIESNIVFDGIHLIGDSELESMVIAAGGRPAEEVKRIRARRLDKKAFALYGEDVTEDIAEILSRYTGNDGAGRLENEISDACGIDAMDVCAEVTSKANLQGKMSVGKTDVSISDGGKVWPLSRFSPLARSLQSRNPYGWALIVACPEKYLEPVSKSVRRMLSLNP